MFDVVGKILESTIGVPVFGAAALVLIFVIYRMARHEILLFGHFDGINQESRRYSFYVQNLEHVAFPGPFVIAIKDRRPEGNLENALVVNVFAGPKHVVRVPIGAASDNEAASRIWAARFEELPPLDTWLFVCDDKSSWLELSFDTGQENIGIKPKLVVDVSRRKLNLRPERPDETYEGLTHTPSKGVFVGTLLAAVLGYLGSIPLLNLPELQMSFRVKPFAFDWTDLVAVAVIAALLAFGFRSIQRSVYPIIQGYFEETDVIEPKPPIEVAGTDVTPEVRTANIGPTLHGLMRALRNLIR